MIADRDRELVWSATETVRTPAIIAFRHNVLLGADGAVPGAGVTG